MKLSKDLENKIHAFIVNFGDLRIENYTKGGGYYVYYPADKPEGEYIQFCHNLDYLEGWLYGCVQGVRCVRPQMPTFEDEEWLKRSDRKVVQLGYRFMLEEEEK